MLHGHYILFPGHPSARADACHVAPHCASVLGRLQVGDLHVNIRSAVRSQPRRFPARATAERRCCDGVDQGLGTTQTHALNVPRRYLVCATVRFTSLQATCTHPSRCWFVSGFRIQSKRTTSSSSASADGESFGIFSSSSPSAVDSCRKETTIGSALRHQHDASVLLTPPLPQKSRPGQQHL